MIGFEERLVIGVCMLGLVSLLLVALWAYCIFNVISSDESTVRNMPKLVWLLVVIFVPSIGSIAWLFLGRPEAARPSRPSVRRPAPRALGPDDSPEFMNRMSEEARRLSRWEDELRAREEDLRRREEGR